LRFNPPARTATPETAVIRQHQDEAVIAALARLRPRDREVIQLSMWEELPQAAIGELLDCSDRAVTMRLHRALRRLEHELPNDYRPTSAPALAPRNGGDR
jgi:RNA polymerase sigma-70 factor (ECF subfamily)